MTVDLLKDTKSYPRMTRWFNPLLLIKLLNNVVTSAMFGQYADRRLMVAALDTVAPEEHMARATAFARGLSPTTKGPVWIDFVADLGDGFDSTYAVACLLARQTLEFGGETLPRGEMLIMGGDEVYPLANAQTYRNQLRKPYQWASPDHDKTDDDGVPLFAIPGNHDWYDGLVQFLAYFTRPTPTHFGSWRTQQKRSYFAIQLTESWWLWAMDIQLADNMDQPQADYFKLIAQSDQLKPGSKIILCTAEPGWLYTDTNMRSWEIVDYVLGIARKADKALTIPLLLSGDTHHYSRYHAEDGTQFVTSGGGGAFLHPTHQLEKNVSVRWTGTKVPLTLADKPDGKEPAVYPSMHTSRELLWRNLWFALTNWDFSILMGLVYFAVGVLVGLRNEIDIYVLVALAFGAGIIGYTTRQEHVSLADIFNKWQRRHIRTEFDEIDRENVPIQFKKALVVIGTSVLHAAAHIVTALAAAIFFREINGDPFPAGHPWYSVWTWLGLLALEMGAVGSVLGSSYFGLNMLITCRWLRMNRNDAFSALRIGHYNNFLRLRIEGDDVQVHAIGLERVPARHEWRANPACQAGNPAQPQWIAATPLQPHLIEKFVVSGRSGPATRPEA
ncbi:metallophosphoesterase [Bradyrhizobium sp. SRS-191]|uniref:metallophosphoesterase n=1 Tax=Bradyrhizobium sp. SRS-191 TaxID=2962606 RepID=UPI00211E45A0|nr:metallophosphoesterase [Bradyrhizobium sp. SRS-191]